MSGSPIDQRNYLTKTKPTKPFLTFSIGPSIHRGKSKWHLASGGFLVRPGLVKTLKQLKVDSVNLEVNKAGIRLSYF